MLQALHDSELRYRRLFETAQDGILILDAETGMIADVNPYLIKMLGYSREEFVEKKLWEVGAFTDIEASQDAFGALQENEFIRYENLPLKAKGGQLIQVEFISNVYLVDDEKVIQCNIRDITAHKQSEQALRKSEERYRSTLGSMMEGCQIIGYDWRYLFVNDSAASHGKQKKEEMLGRTMMEYYPGIEKTDMFAVLRQCMDERTPHLMENEFIYPNGSKGWFQLSIQPIPEGVFILSIDITERKQANLKLEIQNKELEFQNEEKEKRAAELVIANKDLIFQNEEKEKRAAELIIANKELVFQNEEKEKRAAELSSLQIETNHRLQNIQALQKIDRAILGSLDLNLTLDVVLEQTKRELKVDAVTVFLFNPHTQILKFAAGIGFRSKAIESTHMRLGEGHCGRSALEQKTISILNLHENTDNFIRASLLADEGFVTYFCTPLIAKGQIKGVLEVFHRSLFIPDDDWLNFFEILAGQTAIAIDSGRLFADLQHSNIELWNAYDSTIEGWSHALDLRDKETEGHTQRVTEMTLKLARFAGITDEEMVHVRRGALLHDIGKMGVPDNILLKPDKLTTEELVAMRKHPTFAFDLLSPIAYLRPALDIPYCHHEKWDGSGYPRGLKGEQIPLVARLFAVVDVWDALSSDRPYRQSWPEEKVLEHIRSLAGKHFDPKAVELFLRLVGEKTEEHQVAI